MNLQQLEYFATLAEIGHFGEAAKKLCISQPALSNSIKNLETELGIRLFTRTGTEVLTTSLGKEFHAHVIKAISEINLAIESVNPDVLLAKEKPLRIASVASVHQAVVPSLIDEYREACDEPVSFEIIEAISMDECLELLKNGLADVAVCGQLPESKLCWSPVRAFNVVAVVSPNHPLAKKSRVSLDDLRRFPLASYRQSSVCYGPLQPIRNILDVEVREVFNNESIAYTHLSFNEEAVVLLLNLFGPEAKEPYVMLPIEGFEQPIHVTGVTYRYDAIKTKHVARFVDYVEKRFDVVANAESAQ